MPDEKEEARWRARYELVAGAHQKLSSALRRFEARLEVVEAVVTAKAVDVAKVDRALAKAEREAARKRRFKQRVEESIAARQLRDKP
jgi:hypothetical protein